MHPEKHLGTVLKISRLDIKKINIRHPFYYANQQHSLYILYKYSKNRMLDLYIKLCDKVLACIR